MNAPIQTPRKQQKTRSDKIDETKPASIVVMKGGGLSNFSRDYDFKTSTVHSWMIQGLVPSRMRDHDELGRVSYQAYILHRSKELGHGIVPEDFIEQPQEA